MTAWWNKKKKGKTKNVQCTVCKSQRGWRKCYRCSDLACINCSQITAWEKGKASRYVCNTCSPPRQGIHSKAGTTRYPKGGYTRIIKKVKQTPEQKARAALVAKRTTRDVAISNEAFLTMIPFILKTSDEIAGFGYFDGDAITWMWMDEDAKGSMAHVESDSAAATSACLTEIGQIPNVQWHTHPNMGTTASGTDVTDQTKTVAAHTSMKEKGFLIFLIISDLDWRCYQYDWDDDGEITEYSMGTVKLGETELTPAPVVTRVWTGYHGGYHGGHRTGAWEGESYNNGTYVSHGDGWVWKSTPPPQAVSGNGHVAAQGVQQSLLPASVEDMVAEDVTKSTIGRTTEAMNLHDEINTDQWFMGSLSDDPNDYRKIFKVFEVPMYEWSLLFDAITDGGPASRYYSIIDRPELWDELFRGKWSNKDSDYDKLFEVAKIDVYDWEALFDLITLTYNVAGYRAIVEDPSLWDSVGEYADEMKEIKETKEQYAVEEEEERVI